MASDQASRCAHYRPGYPPRCFQCQYGDNQTRHAGAWTSDPYSYLVNPGHHQAPVDARRAKSLPTSGTPRNQQPQDPRRSSDQPPGPAQRRYIAVPEVPPYSTTIPELQNTSRTVQAGASRSRGQSAPIFLANNFNYPESQSSAYDRRNMMNYIRGLERSLIAGAARQNGITEDSDDGDDENDNEGNN